MHTNGALLLLIDNFITLALRLRRPLPAWPRSGDLFAHLIAHLNGRWADLDICAIVSADRGRRAVYQEFFADDEVRSGFIVEARRSSGPGMPGLAGRGRPARGAAQSAALHPAGRRNQPRPGH